MKLYSQNSPNPAIFKMWSAFFCALTITGDMNDFVQNSTISWFYLINGNKNQIRNIFGNYESKKWQTTF